METNFLFLAEVTGSANILCSLSARDLLDESSIEIRKSFYIYILRIMKVVGLLSHLLT